MGEDEVGIRQERGGEEAPTTDLPLLDTGCQPGTPLGVGDEMESDLGRVGSTAIGPKNEPLCKGCSHFRYHEDSGGYHPRYNDKGRRGPTDGVGLPR